MHENQLFLGRNAIKKLDFVLFLEKSCIFAKVMTVTVIVEDAFREKVDKVLEQTPELRKMTIHIGSLSLEDM